MDVQHNSNIKSILWKQIGMGKHPKQCRQSRQGGQDGRGKVRLDELLVVGVGDLVLFTVKLATVAGKPVPEVWLRVP